MRTIALGLAVMVTSLGARLSSADVILDFSGTCFAGDCEPGTKVIARLQFTDNAELHHRNRAVSADDFVSLALSTPGVEVGRVEVTWTNSPGSGMLPIDVLIDELGILQALRLRDERKNLFQVDPVETGGAWSFRFLSSELDVALTGSGGSFGPVQVVAEPGALAFFAFGVLSLGCLQLPRARRRRKCPAAAAIPIPAKQGRSSSRGGTQ